MVTEVMLMYIGGVALNNVINPRIGGVGNALWTRMSQKIRFLLHKQNFACNWQNLVQLYWLVLFQSKWLGKEYTAKTADRWRYQYIENDN